MRTLPDAFRSTTRRETLASVAHTEWFEDKNKQNTAALLMMRGTVAGRQPTSAVDVERTSRPLIAVVDDEVVIAITLAELLNRHGFRAVWFTSPVIALDFMKRVTVDLLLSDIQMPDLDGLDLSRELAHVCPMCPVLLLSGNCELLEQLAASRSINRNVFLAQKPINVPRLIELLSQLLPGALSATVQNPSEPGFANKSFGGGTL